MIHRLHAEVDPLERKLRVREAEEAGRLRAEEQRVAAAKARLNRALATLKVEATQLEVVERQREQLLERIKSWRGEVWKIGHQTAAILAVAAAVTSMPLVAVWFGGGWALGVATAQLVTFGALFFIIPGKR